MLTSNTGKKSIVTMGKIILIAGFAILVIRQNISSLPEAAGVPQAFAGGVNPKYLNYFRAPFTLTDSPAEINKVISNGDDSPFDGYFTNFTGYSGDCVDFGSPDVRKKINAAANFLKNNSEKKFWPMVWLNPIVGYAQDDESPCCLDHHGSSCKPGRFCINRRDSEAERRKDCSGTWGNDKIKLADLWNEQGALTKWYSYVGLALRTAKTLDSPGIGMDFEGYSDYRFQDIEELSSVLGKTQEEIKSRLKAIGANVAGIINDNYKSAVIWTTYANVEKPFDSSKYILDGMLDEAKQKGYSFRVIDGGETRTNFYLYSSLNYVSYPQLPNMKPDIKNRLSSQRSVLSKYLSDYPQNFFLGGTEALYPDADDMINLLPNTPQAKQLSDWKSKGILKVNKIGDFSPLLKYLFSNREYVWVSHGYAINRDAEGNIIPDPDGKAKGLLGYEDFDPVISSIYRPAIWAALDGNGSCEKNRGANCKNSPKDCGSCPPEAVAGDLNGDSIVNQADLDILQADFLKEDAKCSNPKSDIDKDGIVTIKDAGILFENWK